MIMARIGHAHGAAHPRTAKPLIPLNGKPLIDHVIDRLVQGGVISSS